MTACQLPFLISLLDAYWQGLPHPGDQPEALAEEEYADAVVADILTIARSPVFDSMHSRAARRSLADHLVEEAEHWDKPQTEEDQMRVASAAFDEHRSAWWQCWLLRAGSVVTTFRHLHRGCKTFVYWLREPKHLILCFNFDSNFWIVVAASKNESMHASRGNDVIT